MSFMSKFLDYLLPVRVLQRSMDAAIKELKDINIRLSLLSLGVDDKKLNTYKSTQKQIQPEQDLEDPALKIHQAGGDITKSKMSASGQVRTEHGDDTASKAADSLGEFRKGANIDVSI